MLALIIGIFVFCVIWVILSFALGVSIGVAFLILLGICIVVGVVAHFISKLEKKQIKKVITIASIVVLVAFCVFVLVKCTGNAVADIKDGKGDTQWNVCYGCNGDGITTSGGKCSRCGGVGYIAS